MLTLCVAVLPIKVIVIANDAANLNFRARGRACYVRYVCVCVRARAIDVWMTDVMLFMNYGYNWSAWYRWNVAMPAFPRSYAGQRGGGDARLSTLDCARSRLFGRYQRRQIRAPSSLINELMLRQIKSAEVGQAIESPDSLIRFHQISFHAMKKTKGRVRVHVINCTTDYWLFVDMSGKLKRANDIR